MSSQRRVACPLKLHPPTRKSWYLRFLLKHLIASSNQMGKQYKAQEIDLWQPGCPTNPSGRLLFGICIDGRSITFVMPTTFCKVNHRFRLDQNHYINDSVRIPKYRLAPSRPLAIQVTVHQIVGLSPLLSVLSPCYVLIFSRYMENPSNPKNPKNRS